MLHVEHTCTYALHTQFPMTLHVYSSLRTEQQVTQTFGLINQHDIGIS